jgi:predicted  nucleic acid-binding Zn-ribbon protein
MKRSPSFFNDIAEADQGKVLQGKLSDIEDLDIIIESSKEIKAAKEAFENKEITLDETKVRIEQALANIRESMLKQSKQENKM